MIITEAHVTKQKKGTGSKNRYIKTSTKNNLIYKESGGGSGEDKTGEERGE